MARRRTSLDTNPGDHLCWGYDDREALRWEMRRWMEEGVAGGQRVLVIGSGRLGRAGSNVAREYPDRLTEQLVTVAPRELFRPHLTGETNWHETVRAEIVRARRQGRPLRVLCDVSAMAEVVDQDEYLRWELSIGDMVAAHSMTVMCAFDAPSTHRGLMNDLATCHQEFGGLASPPLASIHFASGVLTLAGELDMASHRPFEAALSLLRGDVVVDLGAIDFMDLRSMSRLRRFVEDRRRSGHRVELRDVPPMVERGWAILDGIE